MGYVYFVACKEAKYRLDNPYIKIGRTLNLENRLKGLQTGSPVELCFIGYIETDASEQLEKYFHRIFSKDRSYGEWFKVTENMISRICSYDIQNNLFHEFFEFDENQESDEVIKLKAVITSLRKVINSKNSKIGLLERSPAIGMSNRAKKRALEDLKFACVSEGIK